MTSGTVTIEEIKALGRYDTPTICNALEVVAPERRTLGFTDDIFVCADPSLPPIVGFARTASIRAGTPSPLSAKALAGHHADYYQYVAKGAGPTVAVIQDLDARPGFGAFWGEVNTSMHKALGCLGAVTNGSIRDLDMLAPGFQLLAGKIGPSHAHVHVAEIGCQVNVLGMVVEHGDLIHADRHGAVVIPAALAGKLPAAADLVARREKVILDVCKSADFDIERLLKAMARSDEVH